MKTRQNLVTLLGFTNLLLGVASFIGPLVTGNRDRVINIRPGFLFGIFAVNWLHALLHLMVGVAGVPLRTVDHEVRNYLRFHGILFAVLAMIGWWKARSAERMFFVMGMALDIPGTMIHTVWAALGLWFGFKASEHRRRDEPTSRPAPPAARDRAAGVG